MKAQRDPFGAQAHELRGRTAWPAHEAHAAAHERLHRASPASVHLAPAPVWPVQREPKAPQRHAHTSTQGRLPAYQAAAEPAPHSSLAEHQRPARHGAQRVHQQAHHSAPPSMPGTWPASIIGRSCANTMSSCGSGANCWSSASGCCASWPRCSAGLPVKRSYADGEWWPKRMRWTAPGSTKLGGAGQWR